ncbi:BirA family biotin operon repressor/biotin-[acetyl-CoA-carboxylase] ligase [Roseinatronobacter thiooxidans]|uniref:biotin--[biotin carboxyl-carrier protein] ligase n=1 Tax=Roseinatronobacter thiooxidans TaxID=121821 RepID=A0A2W7QWF2_9RHOB|nr:biotin--[acetyl-CoA-carboxylase] ligase [Roseinatronobacter thiooxidans]PZX48017.1 BirA family biotin operon repressor/biotin-[acetyl-CoA-carboxylase] ligase [Roseinatronobacter thiooxidans]
MSSNWPDGVGRVILPEIDSTNAEAARIAPTLSGPVWILAHRQTKGRGRRGREWRDPAGNFAATYVSRPGGPPDQVALRSFVAALALDEALVTLTGRPESFAIKWPNDVLLHGGKLAGILLESIGHGAQVGHLAIGIGVNLQHAPMGEAGAVPPVSLMAETGILATPEAFLDILAPIYARWDHQLATFGFAPIRQAWLNRAARLGQAVIARTVSQTYEGTFAGIDSSGALLLQMPQELRAIPAADVYFS